MGQNYIDLLFDIKGIIYYTFVPAERTVKQAFCIIILERLCQHIQQQKRANTWTTIEFCIRSMCLHTQQILLQLKNASVIINSHNAC
jgi:hypothetical protein